MEERGLLVKLGVLVEGSGYYRFLSWRRILFEEFGQDLSPETGKEISGLMPKVAARRLCRLVGCLYTPAREALLLAKLTRYYASYMMEVEKEDFLPRAQRIAQYCQQTGMRACLIVPGAEGNYALDFSQYFSAVCHAGMGEDFYHLAAGEMGLTPQECLLLLSDDEDSQIVLVGGMVRTLRVEEMERQLAQSAAH